MKISIYSGASVILLECVSVCSAFSRDHYYTFWIAFWRRGLGGYPYSTERAKGWQRSAHRHRGRTDIPFVDETTEDRISRRGV